MSEETPKYGYEEEKYDPEQWKMEITKVENGYIIRNLAENSVMVVENEPDELTGMSAMLYNVAYEFGGRVEVNVLDGKHDYTKDDFKSMLKDVHRSYNEDDHDVTKDTLEQLEELFGKFSWRDKK